MLCVFFTLALLTLVELKHDSQMTLAETPERMHADRPPSLVEKYHLIYIYIFGVNVWLKVVSITVPV